VAWAAQIGGSVPRPRSSAWGSATAPGTAPRSCRAASVSGRPSRGLEILDLFSAMHQRGETILVVTHDPRIAERCQRVVQIVDGVIVDDRMN
jgi:hypothetical protein